MFRRVWNRKSNADKKAHRPSIAQTLVALIMQMAAENQGWGAKRIRGELLNLGLKVGRTTIQKYINRVRRPLTPKQSWATFLRSPVFMVFSTQKAKASMKALWLLNSSVAVDE